MTDVDCIRLVDKLSKRSDLTGWETDFIASNLRRNTFSVKQKDRLKQLKEKYNVQL